MYMCLYGYMYIAPLSPSLNIGQLATDLPEAARTLLTKNIRQTFRKTPTSRLLDGLYINRLILSYILYSPPVYVYTSTYIQKSPLLK